MSRSPSPGCFNHDAYKLHKCGGIERLFVRHGDISSKRADDEWWTALWVWRRADWLTAAALQLQLQQLLLVWSAASKHQAGPRRLAAGRRTSLKRSGAWQSGPRRPNRFDIDSACRSYTSVRSDGAGNQFDRPSRSGRRFDPVCRLASTFGRRVAVPPPLSCSADA